MSSVQEFYARNAHRTGDEIDPDVEARAMRTPGHRYFCVFDRLADRKALRAVELGFGSFTRSRLLAAEFADFQALDIAATELTRDRDVDIDLRQANLDDDWPLDDASVDVVIAMMVFEHLFDPFHSFAELARVLKPGGCGLVNVPNIASIRCRWDLLRGRMPITSSADWFEKRHWDGGHLHNFTIANIRRVAALNNLQVDRIYPVGNAYTLKRRWPALLCHEISYVLVK